MQNYTDVGFKKIRAPQKVFKLIKVSIEEDGASRLCREFNITHIYDYDL
jgi:hypothetical protein